MTITTQPALCQGPCRPPQHGGPRRTMPGTALCDVCEESTWEDLHYLAGHWADLEDRLGRDTPRTDDGIRTTSATTGITINEPVSQARREITATIAYWVHVILTEEPRFTGPPGTTTDHLPEHARWVARHVKRLTRHHDHGLAASVAVEARELRRTLRRLAFPTGARLFAPGIPCLEHVDVDGRTQPCPGVYQVWITDRIDTLPDLVCTADPAHVLEPARWRRVRRDLTLLNPDAVATLVARITRQPGDTPASSS